MGNHTFQRSQDMKTLVLLTIVAFAYATPSPAHQAKFLGPRRGGAVYDGEIAPSIAGNPATELHRKKRQVHQEIAGFPRISRARAMELHRKKRQDYVAPTQKGEKVYRAPELPKIPEFIPPTQKGQKEYKAPTPPKIPEFIPPTFIY